jgi:hypothetical protein
MKQYFLITGSRDWPNDPVSVKIITDKLDSHLRWHPDTVMINGRCPTGVDQICYEWAILNKVELLTYPAEWEKYGKAAGPKRNMEMLQMLMSKKSSIVYAFFYGDPATSRGTANMVRACRMQGIEPTEKVLPRVQV